MQAIRDYEANQAEIAKPLIKDHKAAIDVWEAKRAVSKRKFASLPRRGSLLMNRRSRYAILNMTNLNRHGFHV